MIEEIPPAKRFASGDRIYVQAQQIWLILSAIVMLSERNPKKPTKETYGDLAKKMGYPDKRAGHMLSRQLGIVGMYCVLNDLPTLNSIVVNATTGQPGHDVVTRKGKSFLDEQSDTMKENWFQIRVPTTGTFRKVWSHIRGDN
jgi:hypothetical protein